MSWLTIAPSEIRTGDLLVDENGDTVCEVLSASVDASGYATVIPVPCANPSGLLLVDYSPGMSVHVMR